jgi:hypothetical protein
MSGKALDFIAPERLYPSKSLMAITGLGPAAMREARKSGLLVRYIHRRPMVLGEDFIRYVLANGIENPFTSDRPEDSGVLALSAGMAQECKRLNDTARVS